MRELAVHVIKRSMAIKAEIVSQDERETLGIRTLLNYGHTIGHGIEAAAGYGEYMHGEAVSVGMMGAATIGQTAGVHSPGPLGQAAADSPAVRTAGGSARRGPG